MVGCPVLAQREMESWRAPVYEHRANSGGLTAREEWGSMQKAREVQPHRALGAQYHHPLLGSHTDIHRSSNAWQAEHPIDPPRIGKYAPRLCARHRYLHQSVRNRFAVRYHRAPERWPRRPLDRGNVGEGVEHRIEVNIRHIVITYHRRAQHYLDLLRTAGRAFGGA